MASATNNSGDGNSNIDSNNGHARQNPHHTEPASNHSKEHNHNRHGDEKSGHSHHDHNAHHRMMIKDFKRRLWISLIFSIPVLALSPLIQKWTGIHWQFSGDDYVLLACASFVFIYGGWPFLKGLIRELRTLSPGMMTLIAVAITVAYGYSVLVTLGLPGKIFFWELVTLIDIMLLGHWVEMRSILGASRSLEELAALMPDTAHRMANAEQYEMDAQNPADDAQSDETRSGSNDLPTLSALLEKIAPDDATDVSIKDVQTGDVLLIKPGEKVPADGEIIRGQSSLNESMISGESRPVQKSPGDDVVGGAVNQTGSLYIRVRATGDDSYLSRVVELVRKAQESKSRTQRLADRAAAWLTFIALGSGAITLAIWLLLDAKFVYALERMVSVMVVTCPHALGLAVPLVIAISTAMAAQKGLLIRNRSAFESARRITTVLFDKTGTLTEGNFAVRDVKTVQAEDGNQILRIAAAIEFESEHPIGRAIVEHARTQQLTIPEIR
ncbi:MAG: HAD-IC family P-type ATPase, partial [Leptospiraceae bacterium]|nr:HAD-IC family P-type ATPase [Leptospiraceae bacterium]